MATIIDSLIVTLGLDSKGFNSGKQKVDSGLKDTGKAADDTSKSFSSLGKGAAAFLAVIGGAAAIKHFVTNTIESSAALDRLSKNLNTNVSTISAWSNAVEMSGGSAAGLQGTMDMLSKAQTSFNLTGSSSIIPFLTALGMSLNAVGEKAVPVEETLLTLADKLSHMDRTQANNMAQMYGGIDQGTLNLLLQGREAVEKAIKQQKEYGAVTKKQAEESSKMQAQLVRLKQEFAGFGRDMLSEAIPILEKVVQGFSKFAAWIRDNQEFVKVFAVSIAAIGIAAMPINATAVAVVALAAAFAGLNDDYKVWKNGGISAFNWSLFTKGLDVAAFEIETFRKGIANVITGLNEAAAAGDAFFKGDFKGAKAHAAAFMEAAKAKRQSFEDWKKEQPASKDENDDQSFVRLEREKGTHERVIQAVKYYEDNGFTRDQALGMASSIKGESGPTLDPKANKNPYSYGAFQLEKERQDIYKAVTGKNYKDADWAEQLRYSLYELTHNEKPAGDKIKKAKSQYESSKLMTTEFFRPNKKEVQAEKRAAGLPKTPTTADISPAIKPADLSKLSTTGAPPMKLSTLSTAGKPPVVPSPTQPKPENTKAAQTLPSTAQAQPQTQPKPENTKAAQTLPTENLTYIPAMAQQMTSSQKISNTTNINVGDINVTTAATDAKGTAQAVSGAVVDAQVSWSNSLRQVPAGLY